MAKQPTPNPKRLTLGSDEPSLLFAINQLLLTGGINFDEWWKEFSKPPVSKSEREAWTKPKFIEITPKNIEFVGRWIKYWPDREDESTSYTLSGTDRDLVHHINAIAYQGSGSSSGISGKNSKPPLAGFPLVELRFVSADRKYGIKWLRLAGYTDDQKIAATGLAKELTPADIKKYAAKIKTVFGDTKYVWRKGKKCLSYSGQIARLQGLEGYAYVNTQKDGIDLFTTILKVIDGTPDKEGFNFGGSTSTTKYKKPTSEVVVVKEKILLSEKRPIVDCEFDRAVLRLPLLKKPIPLVKRNVILYK